MAICVSATPIYGVVSLNSSVIFNFDSYDDSTIVAINKSKICLVFCKAPQGYTHFSLKSKCAYLACCHRE